MKCVILVVLIFFVLYVYFDVVCWGVIGNGEYFFFIFVWRYKNGIFEEKDCYVVCLGLLFMLCFGEF